MKNKTLLITAATGATGGGAARILLERGYQIRVLAHREDERSKRLAQLGAEVVFGDLLDFRAVRSALQGVEGAYFCYPILPGIIEATAYFAQAAKEAGVSSIVNMSQKSAREDAKSDAALNHWLAERVFDWSGIAVAHLRPTFFAEWLLHLAPMIRAGVLRVPFGTSRHAPIAAIDQSRVIAGILENPAPHRGKIYPLYGAEEVTYAETAQILSRVLGKTVRYEQISFDEFAQLSFIKNRDPYLAQHLREVIIDHHNGIFAGTSDLVEKIGGQAPTPLADYIQKHRAAFVESAEPIREVAP